MQKSWILLIAALVFLIGVAVWLAIVSHRRSNNNTLDTNQASNAPTTNTTTPTATKLEITDEVVGTGTEAKTGDSVTVNYIGTLADGTKFDSSYDRSEPFSFTLGAGQVIKGWDEGIIGMKEGGKRKLVIPAPLGYGSQGFPPTIPGGATLIFEVELLSVQSAR